MVFVLNPGVLSFTHIQSVPSATWTINHNFNKSALAVDTMIDVNGELHTAIPENILYPTADSVIIEWSSPRTGQARLA